MSRPAQKKTVQEEVEELTGIKAVSDPDADPEESQDQPAEEEQPEPEAQSDSTVTTATEEQQAETETEEPEQETREAKDEAIRAEIRRLRAENRRLRGRELPVYSPPPAPPVQQAQGAQKKLGVPLKWSEDGTDIAVDPDGLGQFFDERVERAIEQRLKPTPEQVQAMEHQQALHRFTSADPVNRQVYDMAQTVNAFLFEKLASEISTTGVMPRSVGEVIEVLGEIGAIDELRKYSPEFADHVDDFLESQVGGDMRGYRIVLKNLARDMRRGAEPEPVRSAQRQLADQAKPRLVDVAKLPRALSSKGGGRSQGAAPDEAEFQELDRQMREDWLGWAGNKSGQKRLEFLGRKLGKPGFV